jgi:ABC-type nitrate/sulfonate/bicarbonate transport system substrate-binding protein
VAFFTPAVAHKRGFFKEEGIEAELIRMNANISVTALATGDIHYTMIFGSVVRAATRGLPVTISRSFVRRKRNSQRRSNEQNSKQLLVGQS